MKKTKDEFSFEGKNYKVENHKAKAITLAEKRKELEERKLHPDYPESEEEWKENHKAKMKTEIKCPTCNSTFDISTYLDVIKNQLIEKIEKIIKEIKNEKQKEI